MFADFAGARDKTKSEESRQDDLGEEKGGPVRAMPRAQENFADEGAGGGSATRRERGRLEGELLQPPSFRGCDRWCYLVTCDRRRQERRKKVNREVSGHHSSCPRRVAR